ncbi:MAG: DUF4012 domain-containing protein [Anaerolineae bacterium]
MNLSDDTGIVPPVPSSPAPLPVPHRRRKKSRVPKWIRNIRKLITQRIKWRTAILVSLTVIAVVVVSGLVLVADAFNRVQSSLTSLDRVVQTVRNKPGTGLTLTDFNRLQASVVDLSNTLGAAKRQIGFLTPFSSFNADIPVTLASINSAYNLSLAANEMLKGLQPTIFFLVAGNDDGSVVSQAASGDRVVELMNIGRGQVFAAKDYLDAAAKDLAELDVTQLSAASILNINNLNNYRIQLLQINEFLSIAPDLLTGILGLSGEQNYLVLSQNSDELRPSGGYISTFGWLSVRDGRVTDYSYSPTTATSPNPPPASLAGQVPLPNWWIRYGQPIYAAWDGSWYADFPSTANMAAWFYDNGNNPKSPVDGVIAIDIVGFEYILKALGSVALPEYDRVVTPENFREAIYDIRASSVTTAGGDAQHKQFLAALYQQIFAQWEVSNSDSTIREQLIGTVLQALQEKHIMLYFSDDQLNQAAKLLGWAGEQVPVENNDYLMVADANLGNKSNRSIIRDLTYDVDIQMDGSANSRLTVAYDYSARIAADDPAVNPQVHGPLNYDNLLQVFVPPTAQLASTSDLQSAPVVVDNNKNTIWVSQFTVDYDTSKRIQYLYETPHVVENIGTYHRYRLLIQKQPGTIGDIVNVQVMLPAPASILNVTPTESARYSLDRPVLEFRLSMTTDHLIEIAYTG